MDSQSDKNEFNFCEFLDSTRNDGKSASEACCVCNCKDNEKERQETGRALGQLSSCLRPKRLTSAPTASPSSPPRQICGVEFVETLERLSVSTKQARLLDLENPQYHGETTHEQIMPYDNTIVRAELNGIRLGFRFNQDTTSGPPCQAVAYLKYGPGQTTYTNIKSNLPVMSGRFTGCPYMRFESTTALNERLDTSVDGRFEYVAHVGTCATKSDAGSIAAKRQWNQFRERHSIDPGTIRFFNPLKIVEDNLGLDSLTLVDGMQVKIWGIAEAGKQTISVLLGLNLPFSTGSSDNFLLRRFVGNQAPNPPQNPGQYEFDKTTGNFIIPPDGGLEAI